MNLKIDSVKTAMLPATGAPDPELETALLVKTVGKLLMWTIATIIVMVGLKRHNLQIIIMEFQKLTWS